MAAGNLTGTPTSVGSGTITIRATNDAGSSDWTVDYATEAAAAPVLLAGQASAGVVSIDAVLSISAPADVALEADASTTAARASGALSISGLPDVSLTAQANAGLASLEGQLDISALPGVGLIGHVSTGVVSADAVLTITTSLAVINGGRLLGTPTAVGSGTITVRATNSGGSADWTVQYNTSIGIVLFGSAATGEVSVDATLFISAPSIDTLEGQVATGEASTDGQLSIIDTSAIDLDGQMAAGEVVVSAALSILDSAIVELDGQVTAGEPSAVSDLTVTAEPAAPVGITGGTLIGIPTTGGAGTITIRATNAAGNADWTVAYRTSAGIIDVPAIYSLRPSSAQRVASVADNNATQSRLRISRTSSRQWQSFVQFDVSAIPVGTPIRFAALIGRRQRREPATGSRPILSNVRAVSESWTNTSISTWANRPSVNDVVDISVDDDDTAFILTELVQGWVNGDDNYGVRLSQTTVDSTSIREFYGYDPVASRRPRLIVCVNNGVLEQYGGILNHETAADNLDIYNSRLLQHGLASGGFRPNPSLVSMGMVYWNRGKMELDLGGGWKTVMSPETGRDIASVHTLGTASYQAAAGTHRHNP